MTNTAIDMKIAEITAVVSRKESEHAAVPRSKNSRSIKAALTKEIKGLEKEIEDFMAQKA
jgi:hypothetical protein